MGDGSKLMKCKKCNQIFLQGGVWNKKITLGLEKVQN